MFLACSRQSSLWYARTSMLTARVQISFAFPCYLAGTTTSSRPCCSHQATSDSAARCCCSSCFSWCCCCSCFSCCSWSCISCCYCCSCSSWGDWIRPIRPFADSRGSAVGTATTADAPNTYDDAAMSTDPAAAVPSGASTAPGK